MTLPSKAEIIKASNALRLAEQCVRGVLKLDHKHEMLLSIERKSELEAVCVILSKAKSHILFKTYK